MTCTERQDAEVMEKFGEMGKKKVEEERKKIKIYIYIGSMYERGLEHQNDIPACKTSSHMLRHLLAVHEEEEETWDQVRFGMRLIRSTRTAFKRKILESVTIQKERGQNLMNNKSEYNRCALPRLTAKLGEREMSKWREEDKLEMAKEASIEERIRMMKKKKSKERGANNRRMEP